jgi:glycosyltransferase involved in cell wall biosynthesis
MISGAEAHRIGRSLESVASWTSELVVVINEDVQDGTEEIVRRYGGKVFRERWKGFREQKHSAAEKVSQPWILNLDADEVVSPELRDEISALFAAPQMIEPFAAFSFPRLSWYCGRWIRHGDWYPDRSTRLWRRGRARWGGGDVHERLEVDGPTKKLRSPLHHYSRESINAHLKKIIPFSDEFVRQHEGKGGVPGVIDLAFRPLWRFLRAYFFRLGLLDGWPGYYIACHTAFGTLVRYAKLREASEKQGRQSPSPAEVTTHSLKAE